jgi:tetrahydromethanopterin S-methyltransferase subunit F
MIIESKDKEIIIRISSNVNLEEIQKSLDYIRYKELLSKSTATESDIEKLATEVNESWWAKNKGKYIPSAK